jgi:hypothetical protein
MYIANQNFLSSAGFVKEGDEVENPSKHHVSKGLVREIKTVKPETKNVDSKPKRKPANKAEPVKQSDGGAAS